LPNKIEFGEPKTPTIVSFDGPAMTHICQNGFTSKDPARKGKKTTEREGSRTMKEMADEGARQDGKATG